MTAVAAGLLLIRIVVGLLFMAHGLQKLLGWFGGAGLQGTASMFERGGLGPGRITAPLGAIAVLAMMAGAVVAVHGRNGLWNSNGGVEFNLVLAAVALALTLTGPGRWSVDHLAGLRLAGWWWALAAVVVTGLATVVEIALIRTHRMHEGRGARLAPRPRSTARDRDVA